MTHELSHVEVTVALNKSCFSEEVRCEILIFLKSREREREEAASIGREME